MPRYLIHCVEIMSDIEYYNSKPAAKSQFNIKKNIDFEDEEINKRPDQRPRKTNKRLVYESGEEGLNKQTDQQVRKVTKKLVYESDEEELPKRTIQAVKKAPKRKAVERPSVEKRTRPAAGWKLDFDDEAEEIEASRVRKPANRFQSVLTRRVADGCLRRTASLPGDLFVELRLYNTKDIKCVDPKDRWQRAVLSLKYQTDSEADELELLRQFIKRARREFVEDGTFFADKNK
ncbi:hypothetical protein evm_012662 [Chilo suppressalis]|nr:hypothetical protein evm_012662 [Chilo suppressalis]